jgi:hypothetical protein
MGIELPPELAGVAAQAGVQWPEADEDAMARQAQAWRDTAKSMSTLATDADTTARAVLSTVSGATGTAASAEWKDFVAPDTGHLTSVVRDANAAADRLEHAANQVGTAKVEIVRNLVGLAQNQDAAHAAAQAGHPVALAGLDTAVRGTAANVAHIQTQLVSAVQPTSGVDIAALQNPVNANPGHHLLPGVTTDAVVTTVADTTAGATNLVNQTADTAGQVVQGTGNLAPTDLVHHGGVPGDLVHQTGQALGNGPAEAVHQTVAPITGDVAEAVNQAVPGHPGDLLPGQAHPVDPGLLPGAAETTGPVPSHFFPDDAPTPPTGQTVQAGFAGGLEAAPANLPPAAPVAPPLNPAAPAPAFGGTPGFAGTPVPPVPPAIGGAPAPAPGAAPAAPAPRAAAFAPAPAAPLAVDRTPDPAPRKQIAGPPGAPPPARGERNEVLAAFWIHMFPIGHLPVASYRPARQLPPPPPELDYAAGLRFEPADHPDFHRVDTTQRLAVIAAELARRAAAKAAAEAQPLYQQYAPTPAPGYPPPPGHAPADPATPDPHEQAEARTIPSFRPINPSAGLTADHPTVQDLLENHDPLGGGNERDWDRRYLVRLGSVTAHGISPEGLEYNWPTSEQYPEGGSAQGEAEILPEDTVIDRFGDPHGRVFAADGTSFAQRSLPPAHKDTGYRRYKVVQPLPVWRAVSAAWFGQPGGGIRYRTTHSAAELVALGYLEEIA